MSTIKGSAGVEPAGSGMKPLPQLLGKYRVQLLLQPPETHAAEKLLRSRVEAGGPVQEPLGVLPEPWPCKQYVDSVGASLLGAEVLQRRV